MSTLLLDTSTRFAAVCLADGEDFYPAFCDNTQRHSQQLLPMLDEVFLQAQTEIANVSELMLINGPGSFTGLRISCAIVQGFMLAHGLPVACISSLYLAAQNALHNDEEFTAERFIVVLPGSQGYLYYSECQVSNGALVLTLEPMLVEINVFIATVSRQKPIIIADDHQAVAAELTAAGFEQAKVLAGEHRKISAPVMQALLASAKFSEDLPLPNYLSPFFVGGIAYG